MLPIPCIFRPFFAPVFHCFLQTNENGKHDQQLDQQILPGPRLPTTSKACTTARQRLRYLVALLRAWPPFSKYFGTTSTTWGAWGTRNMSVHAYISQIHRSGIRVICVKKSAATIARIYRAELHQMSCLRRDAANLLFLTCSCMWAIEMDITYEYRFE